MTTIQCTACAVQQGTHKPAEALHQITEPKTQQPEALRLAHTFDHPLPPEWEDMKAAAAELRRQHARIVELEAQLAEVQHGVQPYAVLVFERGEEGPFDRKPVKPDSVQHMHAKRDPHYDYVELYTHPTQQGMDDLHKQMLKALESVGAHTVTDCDGDEITAYFCNWQAISDAKRAAQTAKQGEPKP